MWLRNQNFVNQFSNEKLYDLKTRFYETNITGIRICESCETEDRTQAIENCFQTPTFSSLSNLNIAEHITENVNLLVDMS